MARVEYQIAADMSIKVEGPVSFVREKSASYDAILLQRAALTVPRRPGRPPKILQALTGGAPPTAVIRALGAAAANAPSEPPKRRGRPAKTAAPAGEKRRPGRPRKVKPAEPEGNTGA